MTAAARKIAGFSESIELGAIPPEVLEATKLHVLDLLGCGLAADSLGLAGQGRAAMAELGEGASTVIGLEHGMPAPNAAFANAMLAHALDFDDTHAGSVCHISAVVVPAAIAVAESAALPGRELLAAIVAGTETVARIGMAASGGFHARGFHPTSACGVFGAAAAAARLGRLDLEATVRTVGIAGSMASGLLAFLNEGVQTKPIHPAWAAHGGVIAARLAAHGAEGPAGVLDGRFGFYDAFIGDGAGVGKQFADFGERWETLEISFKPFPACHYMHGSLTATTALIDRVGAEEIARIWVTVPESAVAVVCEPTLEKTTPRSDYEGKFSVQYSTAALLVNGRLNVGTYTAESRADPVVQELARKVSYEVKPYDAGGSFPGGTRILTRDGRVFEADFPYQLGAPENPMSAEQVRAKFRDNASASLETEAAEELEERICSLEVQDDLETVFALLGKRAVAV